MLGQGAEVHIAAARPHKTKFGYTNDDDHHTLADRSQVHRSRQFARRSVRVN
ncbi:hypothetical protein ACFV7Q_23335 [Streptomyces sp. NPDC059851]|uniref:hypothetical protein n=1 Tax=Streptomyces sp. NPDC059851 TaxID=3346971 RepID=UPI00364EA5A0